MVTHTAIVDDVIANHTMNVINYFQITSYVVFAVYKYSFSVFESPQHSGGIHDQELLHDEAIHQSKQPWVNLG